MQLSTEGGRGQDCAIETRQSISCMDIRVTARVGVLVAIGNACKRPFDSLLIMKWWRLRNNLGKSGERWSGLVVRWAWRTWRKWGLGDNLLWVFVRDCLDKNTTKPNLGSYGAGEFRETVDKWGEFAGRLECSNW